MANTSATGGALYPADITTPLYDADLDNVFQQLAAQITGLDVTLVRPRYQTTPPKPPSGAPDMDWCALGVSALTEDDGPVIEHSGGNPSLDTGSSTYSRHEEIAVFATFYGANAGRYATLWRDGLMIAQNLESLLPQGIKLTDVDVRTRRVPEFFNQQWTHRFDIGARFRRKVERVYQILSIVDAPVELVSDDIGIITGA